MLIKNNNQTCKKYHNNSLLLVCLGLLWMISAFIGSIENQLSILSLFIGAAIISPLMSLIRKALRIPYVNDEHPARMALKCLAITIPFGMIAGFFLFVENMNVFYPVFMLIFGLTFGIIGLQFGIKSYTAVGIILIAASAYVFGFHAEKFLAGGYIAAVAMIAAGIVSRYTESSPAPLKLTFNKSTATELRKAA